MMEWEKYKYASVTRKQRNLNIFYYQVDKDTEKQETKK